MQKPFYINLSITAFVILCLFFSLIRPAVLQAQSSLDMKDYTAEMIESEYQSLLNILGNKDGVGGPNTKNRTQVLKTKHWGVSAIEKTVWNSQGFVISYDIYAMKDGILIWEHEEPVKTPKVHFLIKVNKNRALVRQDLTKITIAVKTPTKSQSVIPVVTPTATSVPPTAVPPTATSVPPTSVPPTATSVPPTAAPPTEVPPTATQAPPTATQAPPTATHVPPTATSIPSRDKIVFVSNRDGNLNIYTMDLDGSNVKRITSNPANEAYPCVSPDGKKLTFASNRDGNWEIYVIDIDGREENSIRLTYNTTDDLYPSFTSDSKRVIFQSNRDGNIELYMVNIDNPKVQERLTINDTDDIHPRVYKEKF